MTNGVPAGLNRLKENLGLPLRPGSAIVCAMAYLGLHALCIAALPKSAPTHSDGFMFLAPLLAVAVSWSWVSRSGPRLRLCGGLVVAGLMLWTAGNALDAWPNLHAHSPASQTQIATFFYFFYGVPLLLAVSTSSAEQRSKPFLLLYALQALVIAYLAYIVLFNGTPFSKVPPMPVSADRLAHAFLIENLLLAGAATVRLFSCSGREERRFYRILAGFLWLYLACSTLYNFELVGTGGNAAAFDDLFIDIPFLTLALWFAYSPARPEFDDAEPSSAKSPLALFIASASPIFFTFGLLALGSVVMRRDSLIGAAGVAIALGCYGLQATMLQNRYIRSQHSLREALERLQNVSLTDGLTGIANRRCFDAALDREWSRAKRSQQPLSLLMIDLDFFKNLNDRYGHVYGDECLVTIAQTLRAALPRDADVLARYGGEEFAAILPDTDRAGAATVAGKMRAAVRRLAIRNETPLGEVATISIGVSTFDPASSASCVDLIKGSDRALYRAKQDGRDRIAIYSTN